jgi:CheY-like chemotaxis protein
VVEDSGTLRRVAVHQLRDLGCRVIEADGPKAALALLAQEPVDLRFSDVVMPGPMDGLDLAGEAPRRFPSIKVLLTSGFPGVATAEQRAARGGPARLLGKPHRRDELARALHEALHG